MNRDTILIVDDVEVNRFILKQMFEDSFQIKEAGDGDEAISILEQLEERIVIVLLDIRLPKKDGFEVMEYLKEAGHFDAIPIILITSDVDGNAMQRGYGLGATDVIFKPFQPQIVKQRVYNIIEFFKHRNHLDELVKEQTKTIEEQYQRLKEHHMHLIEIMNDIIEYRSVESEEHVSYVQGYTRILAKHYKEIYPKSKLTSEKIEKIVRAAKMHDIGKITMPDAILSRSGKLSDVEMKMLSEHTIKGGKIVKVMSEFEDMEYSKICYNICMYHHAKYDGSGYESDIRKDRIPLEAQLVGLADIYDTLAHNHFSGKDYSKQEIYNMIKSGACGTLSPKMMSCFEHASKELEEFSIE